MFLQMKVGVILENVSLAFCSVSFRVRASKTRNKLMKREKSRRCNMITVL